MTRNSELKRVLLLSPNSTPLLSAPLHLVKLNFRWQYQQKLNITDRENFVYVGLCMHVPKNMRVPKNMARECYMEILQSMHISKNYFVYIFPQCCQFLQPF